MKNIISIFLLLTSLSLPLYGQPTVNGRFVEVTNNGTSYVVNVQISTNTGTNILGDATIPFTFDTANLVYVNTSFDNFSGGDYNIATATTNTIANRISLNIVLNNTAGGTVVSNTFMDVATITFNTINSVGSSNFTFVSPLEFFSPSAIQWTIGTFTNLNTNPLPVELSSFSAVGNQNGVNLKWETATEVNNYGFDVERKIHTSTSLSVTAWEKVGFVNGNGNSNSPKTYSFRDENPNGGSKFQYRLKQIDNDGQFKYSNIVEIEIVPTQFELSQNYPNPFNPTTNINYELPIKSNVCLKIFDILGNEIVTLVNEEKEAGYYELKYNAKDLASGIYFYNISAGEFNRTKKMLLLR